MVKVYKVEENDSEPGGVVSEENCVTWFTENDPLYIAALRGKGRMFEGYLVNDVRVSVFSCNWISDNDEAHSRAVRNSGKVAAVVSFKSFTSNDEACVSIVGGCASECLEEAALALACSTISSGEVAMDLHGDGSIYRVEVRFPQYLFIVQAEIDVDNDCWRCVFIAEAEH